jgi:DNA-binding NarL/FixJ family response regulator
MVDLVILDYQVPGVDRYQLFRELQALDAGVAVLVASGFLSNLEIARWLEAGVNGIIYLSIRPFA